MSRYYIDCEFDGHNGPLISMAIVRRGAPDSLVLNAHPMPDVQDPWVRENVLSVLHCDKAEETRWRLPNQFGDALREFIGDDKAPVIVADSPQDISRFCVAIATSESGGYSPNIFPCMTFEVHNVDCYPTTLPGAVQHNAWWDAMALRHKLTQGPSS
jgi:hypothetical protein